MNKLILALTLALSGCYQVVDSQDMYNAVKACGSRENVYEIEANFIGAEFVTCTDGRYIRISSRTAVPH